jgi:hypothetical protein
VKVPFSLLQKVFRFEQEDSPLHKIDRLIDNQSEVALSETPIIWLGIYNYSAMRLWRRRSHRTDKRCQKKLSTIQIARLV